MSRIHLHNRVIMSLICGMEHFVSQTVAELTLLMSEALGMSSPSPASSCQWVSLPSYLSVSVLRNLPTLQRLTLQTSEPFCSSSYLTERVALLKFNL